MRKKTIENYLELIYSLQKEKKRIHTNDVACILRIAPASVTEVFQKLNEEGYIDYEKYSGAMLTDKGKRLAICTKKKHDKLTEFLLLLGIDKRIAEKDACEMEHILHSDALNRIIKLVEVINQCEAIPIWLKRLRKYGDTGKLSKCPKELIDICIGYHEDTNAR